VLLRVAKGAATKQRADRWRSVANGSGENIISPLRPSARQDGKSLGLRRESRYAVSAIPLVPVIRWVAFVLSVLAGPFREYPREA